MKHRENVGKVLLLGKGTSSFLSIIRSLGRRKLEVHVAWCPQDSYTLRSKYVTKFHAIPPYSTDNDYWKNSLIKIIKTEEFDLVIPCTDSMLIPIQTHREEFEKAGSVYLLNNRAYDIAFDKFKTSELARSLGISTPREMVVSNPIDVKDVLARFSLPVVIKPQFSYFKQDVVNRNRAQKIYNEEKLAFYLDSMDPGTRISIQENFIGTGLGIEVLAENGEILFVFQHVRVHQPLGGGAGSYRKSVLVQPELIDAVRKLIKALDYTGVAMVEFIFNFSTREWIFIEINARFWGSLPLAIAAGADFPYYLYQLLVEGKRDFEQRYKIGIYSRALIEDLFWLRNNFSANHSDPTLHTLPFRQVVKEIRNVFTFRERIDSFVMDDPLPGFIELANFTRNIIAVVFNKILLFRFYIPPLRKIYLRKIHRALRKAQIILFVCMGNICRSPFAENYAKTKGIFQEPIKVLSTGYFQKEGRISPREAVEAARGMGVNLSTHRSTVISEELVRQADIIFTFDEVNRKTIINRYPFAKSKVYRLGLLAQRVPIEIEDPWGGSVNKYKLVFGTIIQTLDSYVNSR